MLQPQKKKLNPSQKTRAITPKTKSKAPATYDVDWDAVRSVNDNVAVQAAKMFDPTGITSYPDIYYAAKDLSEGKGSWGELGLNILGALPVFGKLSKGAGMLAKSQKLTKVTNKISKVNRVVDKVERVIPNAAKMIGNTSGAIANASRAGRANPIAVAAKVVGKVAKNVEKADTATRKVTGKILDKIPGAQGDVGNLVNAVSSTLNIANTASDVKAVVDASNKNSKPKTKETVKPKVIYYNTDPKRGEVEKPGQFADIQYVPVSNSVELKKWKEQKLALGTGEDGINPNKPWLAPSSTVYQDPNFDFLKQTQEPMDFSKAQLESQGFADMGVSKNIGKFNVDSGINFNPESLAARVGASFSDKGFNSALNYTQGEKGLSEVNINAGYGNDFIQGEVDYSNTNSGDSLSGNLSAGNDKLRMILEYLKDSEGTNLKGGIQSTTALRKGLLNSALEVDTNFEDPKISGRINYTNPTGRLNLNAGASYSEGEKANFNAGLNYSFALGTDKNGIMKSKMNPRKKYANGTDAKGMNPNNYIISPSEALADYDIMMAKAENAAVNNPWAPYVSAIGGAASSFLSNSAGLLTADGAGIKGNAGGILKKAISKGGKIALNSAGSIAEGLAAYGMNNVQADVEVEDGERYKTPAGKTGEFKGATHEENGIPLEVTQDPNANPEQGQAPEGTQIFSDRLKVGNKTIAEREASRERQTANLEKIASQPLVDQAVKNATKRRMMAIQKEQAADLDFQEKVNNIQQMADTMVAAYGTSMSGIQDNPIGDSMEYGYGSSMTGVQKYDWGTPPFGVKFQKNPYADPLNYDTNAIKNLHDALGIASTEKGYGTAVGPKTLKAYQGFATDYMKKQGYSTANPSNFPDISRFYKNGKVTLNQGEAQALGLTTEGNKYTGPASTYFSDMGKDMKSTLPKTDFSTEAFASRLTETKDPFSMTTASEKFAKDNPLPEGIDAPMAKGIDFQSEFFPDGFSSAGTETGTGTESKGPSKFKQALVGSIPSLGDATKLFGNLLGMNAGIKTATEQRSTDVPFQNVFRNAGEESQRMLDNAKQGIETNKAQAIVKANANTRTGMKGGRGARSFNAKQGMDWLYNTALNQQIADITANAAQQMSGIDIQKSGVAMSADQLKGQGEWQRITADAAAKDAYYTALALGRKDQATGMQQMGKDLNSMKENKIIEGLMKQYGTYFTGDRSGVAAKSYEELTGKNAKEEIFIGPDGKTKFKLGKNNQLTQVT